MDCSLIICTYNWPEALKLVLSSAIFQSEMPNEIIIADDGSESSTTEVIDEFTSVCSIPIIHSWQEDDGCRLSHSRNRAIAKSSFEYIIMVDGDTLLHKDFVKDHKKFAKRKTYLQGSRVLLQLEITNYCLQNQIFKKPLFFSKNSKNKMNLLRIPFITKLISYFTNRNISRIRGCNFSVYKKDVIDINGFNEEIVSWGREDSEFVQRLFNNGVKKQLLKFSAIQYHLYHEERSHNSNNIDILNKAILNKSKWCHLGIDRYFNEFNLNTKR